MSEKVLVFPASVLDSVGVFEGFNPDVDTYANAIFFDEEGPFFKDRVDAEEDESVKQIIPYIIIRLNTDEQGEPKYLVYQRTKKGGESRLMGKHSIGVGGHINDTDSDKPLEAFFGCIRREIKEELDIELHPYAHYKGVIYDPSNLVGRVHFGIVVEYVAKNGNVKARDEAIDDPHFVTLSRLQGMKDQLENWSQLVVDHLTSK